MQIIVFIAVLMSAGAYSGVLPQEAVHAPLQLAGAIVVVAGMVYVLARA
jgi:hypothetical protein